MPKATVAEFAAAVRKSHPEYNDVTDDHQLTEAILKAHPEYGNDVDLRTFAPSKTLRSADGAYLPETDTLSRVHNAIAGAAVGAGKRAIEGGYNLVKGVANVAQGRPAETSRNPDLEAALQPENTAEKVGGVGEQALEFAAGEGAVKLGAGALGLASQGGKILRAGGRILRAAGVGATEAAAHDESATVGAIAGGGGQAAGELIEASAPVLKEGAKKTMARVLGATTKANKARSAQVVPRLVEEGVTGSRAAIAEQATEGVDAASKALDEAWAAKAGQKVNVESIEKKFDEAMSKYESGGTLATPAARPFANTIKQLHRVLADSADEAGNVDAERLRGLRKAWDEVVGEGYATGNLTEPQKAHKVAANAIRNVLADEHPDIAKLNGEVTFWNRVNRVLTDTMAKNSGHVVSRTAGFAGGAIAGLESSRGRDVETRVKAAVIGGATGLLFTKIVQSGRWGSVAAVTKDRLADAIASGNTQLAGDIVRKVAFGVGVSMTKDEQQANASQDE